MSAPGDAPIRPTGAGSANTTPTRVRPTWRLSRRGVVVGVLICAVAAVVAVVETGVLSGPSSGGSGAYDNTYPTSVTRIQQHSLTQQTQVSATLTYAGAETIDVPTGTSPAELLQAQQAVTADRAALSTAAATLASDSATLDQLEASLAAVQAKEAVDCAGANAAQSGSPSSSQGAGGNTGSGGCATDAQTVGSDAQGQTADQAKVGADRAQLASATLSLSGAESALAAAASSAAVYGANATYTSLPAVGAIVHRGEGLYAISGQSVYLLYGAEAPWRAFRAGMSPGSDVAELNANLAGLGYGKGLRGDTFSAATARAIDAFERAHGEPATGQLPLGSVNFEPGAVRVTSVTPTLGAAVAPGGLLTATLTTRQVQIQLDAGEQSDVKVGDPVTITLPDNSTTPGRVSYVGSVATVPSNSGNGGGSGNPTIAVDVTPTDPAATGNLDQAPVNVSITTNSVANALVVPVDALLALSSGGYALEEIGSNGVHHLVGVTLGLFDDQDGDVQVSGSGLAPGQRIVVPNV